ncbi:alpha-amylase family glycosyl hydrolase [Roseivirga sp. BDSF3-8]|uniref:alpha-amylase family glycosyl hydrolase n=1 Tax=Roseivirga sp. BDSF3-8 TaxID=3241598 RepID=UPI003531A0B6
MLFKHLLVAVFSLSLITGCNTAEQPAEEPVREMAAQWPHAMTYEIFVQSFADSDGDSIGDINGMTQNLAYIKNLGAKAIWLMPISPSPSYHKYDITDYQAIHEDYGSLDDFKNFVKKAHEHDIKVIIDLVVNHTDQNHPWFQKAISGSENPYRDYYVWANADSVRESLIAKGRMEANASYIPEWHTREGNEEIYYGFFWQGMPDLNYNNPSVRKEITEIGKFWLEEVKVDGFRLDAALYIYPKDEVEKTVAWWEEFRTEMEKVNKDVYLVGEVWADTEITAPFLNGLDAVFNFDLSFEIVKTIQNEVDSGLIEMHNEIRNAYSTENPEYVDATFLTNHDQDRIMSQLGNYEPKARLAAALLMTLPGSPYIYYGEELGMRGKKPDEFIREPFLWEPGLTEKETRWREAIFSTEGVIAPLAVQKQDSGSLYNVYKGLITTRNYSAPLTYGNLQKVDDGSNKIISFTRSHEDKSVLVMHNLSGEEKQVKITTELSDYKIITWSSGSSGIQGNVILLAPYGSLVLGKP